MVSPTLATFDNAYRLATILVDRTARPHVILAMMDPLRPHRAEPALGQRGAITSKQTVKRASANIAPVVVAFGAGGDQAIKGHADSVIDIPGQLQVEDAEIWQRPTLPEG